MSGLRDLLLHRWHSALSLPRQTSGSWHRARLRGELHELRSATSLIHRLSESSDVLFALSRAKYDGFPLHRFPKFGVTVYGYMVAKYSLRWGFYRTTARMCGRIEWRSVREVVNPGKNSKLAIVAERHGIDPLRFQEAGRRLRRVWPLLP